MPDIKDFHAFKNTSGNNGNGSGCSGNILVWIIIIYAIINFISKY